VNASNYLHLPAWCTGGNVFLKKLPLNNIFEFKKKREREKERERKKSRQKHASTGQKLQPRVTRSKTQTVTILINNMS